MSIGSFGASARAITLPEVAAGLCDIAIPRTTLPNCRATYTASVIVQRVTRELAVMAAPFVFITAQLIKAQLPWVFCELLHIQPRNFSS